jgi:hypothetical protein
MEFIVVAILFVAFAFFAGTVALMVVTVFAGWVCMTLGSILKPILAPIVRVLDTRLW